MKKSLSESIKDVLFATVLGLILAAFALEWFDILRF
jgi:hypothetical protein